MTQVTQGSQTSVGSTGRWIVGFVGTWFILTAMTESNTTADLAAALAVSIAIGATFILLPQARKNLYATGG